MDSRPRDEKGRFVKINSAEESLPIDVTTVDDSFEERKQFLIEQSQLLSNRLNQLRFKIRQTDRTKLEMKAIERQIDRLTQEINELMNESDKNK